MSPAGATRSPSRSRGSGGRLPALLAGSAAVLVLGGVGFGLGVATGVFLEEPRLVLDHLAGRSQTVPIGGPTGGEPATERIPEGEPEPPLEVETGPEPAPPAARAKPAGRAPAEPVAAGPPGPGFAVQVGAFSERAAADRLVRELRGRGHPAYVAAGRDAAGVRFRVRVGPVASRPQAERLAARLSAAERLPTWILQEEGR